MNAREVEDAATDLDQRRQWAVRFLVAGALLAAAAGAAALFSITLAVALGVGSILSLGRAAVVWLGRRELVERLALDPASYSIPEVARFGARVAALRERRRVAAWIASMARPSDHPLELHLIDRACGFAQELNSLASDLGEVSTVVEPATAVACRRLLTRPVQSPLYNPNLTDEDLRAFLLRIRAGIRSQERQSAGLRAERLA